MEDLSRGMQQKLQFAVTAISSPDILILDEPFSALDPVNVDLMKSILQEMRSAGKTIVLSTHIMEQAEQMCDYILLINNGRKVLDGKLSTIRDGYRSNSVLLDSDATDDHLSSLDMVEGVQRENGLATVRLREGIDSQSLLQALVGRCRICRFEEKRATLHEIFVQEVGKHHA